MDNKEIATMFKAFCDENRIQILEMLREGEKCACCGKKGRQMDALFHLGNWIGKCNEIFESIQ